MNRRDAPAGALLRSPDPTVRSLTTTASLLAAVPLVLWATTEPAAGAGAALAALAAGAVHRFREH